MSIENDLVQFVRAKLDEFGPNTLSHTELAELADCSRNTAKYLKQRWCKEKGYEWDSDLGMFITPKEKAEKQQEINDALAALKQSQSKPPYFGTPSRYGKQVVMFDNEPVFIDYHDTFVSIEDTEGVCAIIHSPKVALKVGLLLVEYATQRMNDLVTQDIEPGDSHNEA